MTEHPESDIFTGMQYTMLQHKLSIAMALVTAGLVTFLPFAPWVSPAFAAAIVGFLGTITTTIAKFQTPPGMKTEGDVPKDPPPVTRISGLIVFLIAVLLFFGCTGHPPPRFGIGHCTPAQVELQRAVMTAQVIPAVLACVQAGNAEDCPVADAATLRWLEEREACR